MPQDKDITFYGLSTCPYCKRAKEYMESKSIEFKLIYVDKLTGEERKEAVAAVRKYNWEMSFPTIVMFPKNGKKPKVFVGFTDEAKAAVDAMSD